MTSGYHNVPAVADVRDATTNAVPAPRCPPVVEVEAASSLERRRRDAVQTARAEASRLAHGPGPDREPDSWTPALAVSRYGYGCVALAVAGFVDRAGIEHLRAVGLELTDLATVELVIDCSGLESCHQPLARVLTGVRTRCLSTGARIELHHPPPALTAELGHHPTPETAP